MLSTHECIQNPDSPSLPGFYSCALFPGNSVPLLVLLTKHQLGSVLQHISLATLSHFQKPLKKPKYICYYSSIKSTHSKAVTNLINSLFGTNYPEDSTITYNWTENETDNLNRTLANTILTINHHLRIDLEVQVTKEIFWRERSILYSGRLFDFLSPGEPYANLQRSIHIGILGFDLFPDEEKLFYSRFMFMNEKNHKIYSDKLQIVVLQLNQIHHAAEEDKVHNIHLWARFFKATTWVELNMLAKEDPIFMEAARTIHKITAEEIHRENLRCREKYLASMRTREVIDQQKDTLISQQAEQLSAQDRQLSQQAEQISKMAEMIAELKAELTKRN